VVLLVGAGLFVRTLHNLKSLDAGFTPERVLAIRLRPEQMGYREASRLRAYYAALRERVAATPGAAAVSLADESPLDGRRWTDDLIGESSAAGDVYRVADLNAVSPGFFTTLGIGLLAGRDFDENDVRRADAEPAASSQVAVLSTTAARQLFPGQSPIGQRFSRGTSYRPNEAYEVIGVVEDARYFGLRDAPKGMVYFPMSGGRSTTLLVRTTERPEALVSTIRRHAAAIDPTVPVMDARTLGTRVDDTLASERLLATLCTGFGLLAAALAAVGLYGVLAEGVLRRRREVGIRLALGATRRDVVQSVLRGALRMVVPGALAGALAAFMLARLLGRMLYGVEPLDPWSIALATSVLVLVGAGAAIGPAHRAAGVNPMTALRQE
jgi:putative ABC transport system permease protein